MKRSIIALAILGAVASAPPAYAVVIDFDNLPGGGTIADDTVIADQYSSLGVTFSAFEENAAFGGGPLATTIFAPVGQQGNRLSNLNGAGERADLLRIEFSQLVHDISFDFFPQGDSGGATRVVAYDENGDTLSDEVTNISGFPVIAPFHVSANGVMRLEIYQPTDNWNWGMDNLSFTFALTAIPEPTTIALFAGALAVFGLVRRR